MLRKGDRYAGVEPGTVLQGLPLRQERALVATGGLVGFQESSGRLERAGRDPGQSCPGAECVCVYVTTLHCWMVGERNGHRKDIGQKGQLIPFQGGEPQWCFSEVQGTEGGD